MFILILVWRSYSGIVSGRRTSAQSKPPLDHDHAYSPGGGLKLLSLSRRAMYCCKA